MLSKFLNKYKISNKKLLVSVSGGVDSMVLCDLLIKSNLNYSIAHINYKLRGEESDDDQLFLKKYSTINKLNFYSKSYDLSNYTKSIQSIARDIRYEYLNKIKTQYKYDYILTAHHLDDNIETIFLNLQRGKKNNTFLGIKEFNNYILRPLLELTKEEIINYAIKNDLKWRIDSSNIENKYSRNKIRNLIIPIFKKNNSQFRENFRNLFKISNLQNNIMNSYFDVELSKFFNVDISGNLTTKKCFWLSFDINSFELDYFQKFGFFNKVELLKIFKSSTGKLMKSNSHSILSNRDQIIIKRNQINDKEEFFLENGINKLPINIKITSLKNASHSKRNEICISENVEKPLKLRKWIRGDFFYPTGMKGKKKLSKFFKDQKLSIFDKQNQWILSDSKNEVLWIVGLRADRRNLVKNGKCLKVSI